MTASDSVRSSFLDSLFCLEGSAALITGGASGLGLAMGKALAKAGATVVLTDRDPSVVNAADSLVKMGLDARPVVVDAGDPHEIHQVISEVAIHTPPLRIVIANAGISAGPGPLFPGGSLGELDWDRWHDVLRINLSGVMATIRAAHEVLPSDGLGRIIAVSSIAGLRTESAVGYAYAASKAGVLALVRQAALDCAKKNVTVNAIAPGPFETALGGGRIRDEAVRSYFTSRTALGEIASPDDIEGLAVFLSSPSSRYVTGATFVIDGGSL